MKFCTNCDFKMDDDVKFCPKCGTQQAVNGQSNNVPNDDDGEFKGDSEFDGGNNVQHSSMNSSAGQIQEPTYGNTDNS